MAYIIIEIMAFKRETSARKQNIYSTYEPERLNVFSKNASIQGNALFDL
jgi:hypothetical protein